MPPAWHGRADAPGGSPGQSLSLEAPHYLFLAGVNAAPAAGHGAFGSVLAPEGLQGSGRFRAHMRAKDGGLGEGNKVRCAAPAAPGLRFGICWYMLESAQER